MATLLTTSTPRLLRHARSRGARRTLTTAAEAAQQMLQAFEGQTRVQRQVLDGHQLQKLSLTLGRRELHAGLDVTERAPPRGTPLPPGYHLVYFLPAGLEADLGADGTDRTFNAPAPFSRRMWAGGRMAWKKEAALRVGDEAEERTRLVGAAAKRSRDGSEMVLVDVEKELWGPQGLALVDRRAWVFRPPPREPLARSDAQVAGVVPGAVGRHSTVEDVLVDGSGESDRLGVYRISILFVLDGWLLTQIQMCHSASSSGHRWLYSASQR
ncbi:hypothetical protein diail_9408 [Diaporthe ilicicola]|nr:hypothetical protein diail_9408 [Diaporthe ilicicola]